MSNGFVFPERASRRVASVCWLGLCLALIAGCDLRGKPNPKNRPQTPSQVMDFEVLFRRNCSACHGADGTLGPAPPLNDPLFLAIVSKDELVKVIRDGRRDTPMPAFDRRLGGTLTEQQIELIAESLPKHWEKSTEPADALPRYALASVDPAAPPPGDAAAGAKLFARVCADCHGADGEGQDGAAGAINDRDFLSLTSNQALRRIIITGRPDLGMPNYTEDFGRASDFQPLSATDIDNLAALLASWRKPAEVASLRNP